MRSIAEQFSILYSWSRSMLCAQSSSRSTRGFTSRSAVIWALRNTLFSCGASYNFDRTLQLPAISHTCMSAYYITCRPHNMLRSSCLLCHCREFSLTHSQSTEFFFGLINSNLLMSPWHSERSHYVPSGPVHEQVRPSECGNRWKNSMMLKWWCWCVRPCVLVHFIVPRTHETEFLALLR